MRVCLLALLTAATPAWCQQEAPRTPDPVRQAAMEALPPDEVARCRDGDLAQFLSKLPAEWRAAALQALSGKEASLGSDPAVLARLSGAYLALGSGSQALATAEKVLAQDPRNPDALGVKARVLAARGDMNAARQLLAQLPPGHPQAALVQAAIKLGRGPSDEARLGDAALGTPAQSGQSIGSDGGAWTRADYERANTETVRQSRVPGGGLDRGMPGLARNAASEALANSPLGPLAQRPAGEGQSPMRTAAEAALAVSGALLLFGGLGGKQLEQRLPGVRKSMVIGAGVMGASAAGALALSSISIPALTAPSAPQLALAGAGSMGGGSVAAMDSAAVFEGAKALVQAGGAVAGAKAVSDGVSYAQSQSGAGGNTNTQQSRRTPRQGADSPEGQRLSSSLRRPGPVKDRKLQNIINSLFRPGDGTPGGTAGAVRNEITTGQWTRGKWHLMKAREAVSALNDVLANGNLDPVDRATAEALRHDLVDALADTQPGNVLP